MLLLGLDLETTGLVPKTDHITEIGAVLWCTERQKPVTMMSELIAVPDGVITPEITQITGIDQEMTDEWGIKLSDAIGILESLSIRAQYFVAHNAPFDKSFLGQQTSIVNTMPWIDTKEDIPGMEGKRLIHGCAEMGFVNPFPHRALTDVLAMMKYLSMFDLDEVIERAQARYRWERAPKELLIITFPYNDELRERLKAIGGWMWAPEVKQWRKEVADFEVQAEMAKAQEAGFTPHVAAKGEEITV